MKPLKKELDPFVEPQDLLKRLHSIEGHDAKLTQTRPSLDIAQGHPKQDASALQSLLENKFRDDRDDAVAASAVPESSTAKGATPSHFKSRLIKSVVGLALVVAVGWMPAQRLFQVSTVEAVVNARLVTVRAPIGGTIATGNNPMQVGDFVSPGRPIITVKNARLDRSAVNSALDRLQQAKDDRRSLEVQIESQRRMQVDLRARLDIFMANRIRLINAQIGEAEAHLQSALAIETRATMNLGRHRSLEGDGYLATSAMEDAQRDKDVATAGVAEANARKAALTVEAEALRNGDFFGDNYNDEPQSAHRLDEINQSIARLSGEIELQDQRILGAQSALQRAEEAFSLASEAELLAPVQGRMWEILTAPGEQVVEGQDLARLLNCSETIVTATVSESVYNTLSLGTATRFTFSEGGPALPGKIVQLSGLAPASSNFAIVPSALTKESYRVAITVDGAPQDGSCAVGRTGRVVFQPKAS